MNYEKLFKFTRFQRNSSMQLASHYLTACALVHEMAHVLALAASGWRKKEIYYKNECCNEAGFALEQALFGGFVNPREMGDFTEHGHQELAVVSESWPTQYMVDSYNTPGAANQAIDTRWPLDEWSTVTRVPKLFIASMFTDSFWDREVPLMDDGPIEPNPKLSWMTKVVQPGDTYINSVGTRVAATLNDTIVTASPLDTMTNRATRVFNNIIAEQDARRRLNARAFGLGCVVS